MTDIATTPKKLTFKQFINKSTKANVSAAAFLAAHRDWLTTGELAEKLSPIIAQVDQKSLLPTPALNLINEIVVGHHIASEIRKGEEALEKATTGGGRVAMIKNYVASVLDSKGEVIEVKKMEYNETTGENEWFGEYEDLRKSFDLHQRAQEWTMRKLFDQDSESYAEIVATKLHDKSGNPMTTKVSRAEAIAYILKQNKGAFCKKTGKTTSSLSFGQKVSNDRSIFSHG